VDKLGEEKAQELLPPYPGEGPFIIPPEVKSYAGLGTGILDEYARVEAFLDWGGAGVGSNDWVVDGASTITGMPLLANDIHLGLGIPSIWYEMGLHGGGFDVVGASFPGVPLIILGHNPHIAWGVTNVGPDVQDLYIEKINPANPHPAYNPPTHFIATANNKVVPDDYPYFISYEWSAPYRAQRVADLLTAKDKLSIQDFGQIQADTYSIPGEKLVPYLLDLEPQGTLGEQAMEQLRAWDFRNEIDSPGATIFQVFYLQLVENTFADELGDELFEDYLGREEFHHVALERLMEQSDSPWFDDVSTAEVEGRDEIVQRSFKGAIAYLSDRFGNTPSRWTWGRLHTMTFVHNPLGQCDIGPLEMLFNRGPIPACGSGYTVDAASFDYTEPFAVTHGVSYRQIIDLSDWGNSFFIHTTGQSGHPLHRHYADMMAPWQAVEYHPMHFDKGRIEADKERVLILMP